MCIVCMRSPCDPAHLVSRAQGGCDHPLCVVPLCRSCHRAYDEGKLDLSVFLEPNFRDEQAHALKHIGLARLYQRVTNERLAA